MEGEGHPIGGAQNQNAPLLIDAAHDQDQNQNAQVEPYLQQLLNCVVPMLQLFLQFLRRYYPEILAAVSLLFSFCIPIAYIILDAAADACIEGNSTKLCRIAMYWLAGCAALSSIPYLLAVFFRDWAIGRLGRTSGWVIAFALMFGIYLSNIFSVLDIAAHPFIYIVLAWSTTMWWVEWTLAHHHTLGLSACGGMSMSVSLSATLLVKGITIYTVLPTLLVIVVGVLLIKYTLPPYFKLRLCVVENNGNNPIPITPQSLHLQFHANGENGDNTFILRDLEAARPLDGFYELVLPPEPQGNLIRLYDLLPTWPRG